VLPRLSSRWQRDESAVPLRDRIPPDGTAPSSAD